MSYQTDFNSEINFSVGSMKYEGSKYAYIEYTALLKGESDH